MDWPGSIACGQSRMGTRRAAAVDVGLALLILAIDEFRLDDVRRRVKQDFLLLLAIPHAAVAPSVLERHPEPGRREMRRFWPGRRPRGRVERGQQLRR